MIHNQFESPTNIISLDESKTDLYYYDKSPFSMIQTCSSFKETKNQEEQITSNFLEVIKPTPIYSSKPYNNLFFIEKFNLNAFKPYLNNIKIDFYQNFQSYSNINFINKKKYINNNEILFKNKETNEAISKEEKENENSLNLSAFKKIEINNNKNELLYKSSLKDYPFFKKIKINNKKKQKKKLINKIIINESINFSKEINSNHDSSLNPIKKLKLFKSIIYDNYPDKDININNNENELFITKKRRGRKPKNEIKTKRVHNASDYDNILRKIQVHFLSFIIAFTNDLIEAFLPHNKDIRFKNFNYDLKKTVNHSYVEQLKNKTIGEILQFDASSKNRKFDASINLRTYQEICGISPSLKKFFEISYLELFNKYYYKNNRIICFEEKNIIISQKTKLFEDLIQKNIESADKIKQIAINNFIEKQQSYKLPIFKIKKNIINK